MTSKSLPECRLLRDHAFGVKTIHLRMTPCRLSLDIGHVPAEEAFEKNRQLPKSMVAVAPQGQVE